MPAQQGKRWSATLNNYSNENLEYLQSLHGDMHLRYIIIGKEIAPSTGTPHLQIYLETNKKITLKGLKNLLNVRELHLEMSRGSADQNIAYCKKGGDWIELGKPVKERQRTDLEEVKEQIKAGATWDSLWENHFSLMLQYRKGLEEYSNLCRLRRTDPPKVYIWHGVTGTGKTRGAFDMARSDYDDSFWVWPGGPWFDGYRGQRVAIFDEFHGGDEQSIPFSLWKKLCDRYPLTVPVKGGFSNWAPEVIIFTSNIHPDFWWPGEKAKPVGWKDQFNRRTFEIKEFTH